MTTLSSERVTINCDGSARTLFSLRLTKHGDLIIILKKASYFRNPEKNIYKPSHELQDEQHHSESECDKKEILEQRYSIHPSNYSDKKNIIQQTVSIKGVEKQLRTRHETETIKSRSGFAPIFSRRAPDLRLNHYISPKKAQNEVSLGCYDPSYFSLLYTVLVSHKDRTLIIPVDFPEALRTFSLSDFLIGDYRITVIYSFLTMPSHQTGFLSHHLVDTALLCQHPTLNEFASGLSDIQVIFMFLQFNMKAATELQRVIERQMIPMPSSLLLAMVCGRSCRSGLINSSEYKLFIEDCRREMAKNPGRYSTS